MTSVVQYGRRRGSSRSAEETTRMILPPDLRQVTVLSKAEWLRIQDELNQVNKDKESLREAAKQREALHLQSKEVVKLWSNTIARALLLTEVLKEREAQIELKQRIKSASKDLDKDFMDMVKTRDDEALRQEQEKALQKKLDRQAVAEGLKKQIKENEMARERQKAEIKKNGEEIQHLQELYQWEQRMEEERQAEQKRNLMQAHLEHLHNRDLIRAAEEQKQKAEEEQRKCFLSVKQKMMKLRKEKETEMFREAQNRRESIINKLTVKQREQTVSEEGRIAKAVAERDAKQAQQQREEEEKKAAMLTSISTHRQLMRQEKELMDKMEQQNTRDKFQAMKEADRIFSEKQQLKAQRIRDDERKLQNFNVTLMAEKHAKNQQLKRDDHAFEAKNAEVIVEEEKQFQLYSQHVISSAAAARRNVFPLCKAAKEGIGAGLGPGFSGVRPSYLVQDSSGAQMPKYVSGATQNIKKLNEAVDIQEAKRRLGFTW
ncbi:coiled-coil domain-containing protein 173 isoform X2 [Anabas testudineus]|uniref:coiled-coil domain-containing protein 173 isoform X2 n=1 Tax=Anabas testudineus TaxID=64144 RepID=UPI000E459894|nr:coiled-coil domain-containing protein 173 isoform X2 [Anabas testudineus]